MWLRSQGKSIKPSRTALRSFLQEIFVLKLVLLWLTLVICTSVNKLEVKVNRNRDPRLWDMSVSYLQISTWNLYTPSDLLTRTAWIRRMGQGVQGLVAQCHMLMVEVQLAKSCSTVLVQRLLIHKNRFFAFDTQILPIRHHVDWKESLTERWPHCGIERFKKSKLFHIWSMWRKCPSNAAMDLFCIAFNLVMHFKSSAGICNQKEDRISCQTTLH